MNESSTTDYIEYIEHDAVVDHVDASKHTISVSISDKEGCKDCAAANLCSLSNDKNSTRLTVTQANAASFSKGQSVRVRGTEQLHRKAIMLATVIPCIALVAVMVIVYILTFNQLTAALCGLGAMILFFILLYCFRGKIAHEFSFKVIPARQENT